jgi:hypothetical protein
MNSQLSMIPSGQDRCSQQSKMYSPHEWFSKSHPDGSVFTLLQQCESCVMILLFLLERIPLEMDELELSMMLDDI